ncbi:MAG: hypothetical protein LBE85_10065, partial [Candidatus Accumulibacter sp.]|nr:hypothetical protein [Accumulibacter sp.]
RQKLSFGLGIPTEEAGCAGLSDTTPKHQCLGKSQYIRRQRTEKSAALRVVYQDWIAAGLSLLS